MKGKVYIIKPKIDYTEGDVYIGSTSRQYLSQRWGQHRANPVSINKLAEKYGLDNLVCELLEEIEYEDRQELFRKERYYNELMPCINKQIPSRTKQEYRKIYMERSGMKERKQELQNIRRKNRTAEEKEKIRLRHNELQKIRRNKESI